MRGIALIGIMKVKEYIVYQTNTQVLYQVVDFMNYLKMGTNIKNMKI